MTMKHIEIVCLYRFSTKLLFVSVCMVPRLWGEPGVLPSGKNLMDSAQLFYPFQSLENRSVYDLILQLCQCYFPMHIIHDMLLILHLFTVRSRLCTFCMHHLSYLRLSLAIKGYHQLSQTILFQLSLYYSETFLYEFQRSFRSEV